MARPKKNAKPTAEPDQTAVVKAEPKPEAMTEAAILSALDVMGIAAGMDDKTKRLFVAICRDHRLNPLRREIHAVEMYSKAAGKNVLTPVVGYEVYIDRAEASGRLAGFSFAESGAIKSGDYAVTITIYRRDWPQPFSWTVRYTEAVGTDRDGNPNRMWKKMPTMMTRKVAIAQGFRLAFRDVLAGLPYTADELPHEERDATPEPEKEPEPITDNAQRERAKVLYQRVMSSETINEIDKKKIKDEAFLVASHGDDLSGLIERMETALKPMEDES